MSKIQNYQDMPSWFVPRWFELETEQDRRNAKTLGAVMDLGKIYRGI
jgi:hypothetical protein